MLFLGRIAILTTLASAYPISAQGQGQSSAGGISPNISNESGNVNFNYEDFGDKIAQFKIDKSDQSINLIPTKNIKNTTINKINQLLIPKNIGFSEIFHNEKTNNFYVKNHKFSTINRLNITNHNYSYISNTTNNNNSTNINNTNNGTLVKVSGAYAPNTSSETYNVVNGSINGNVYNQPININKTYIAPITENKSYSFSWNSGN